MTGMVMCGLFSCQYFINHMEFGKGNIPASMVSKILQE